MWDERLFQWPNNSYIPHSLKGLTFLWILGLRGTMKILSLEIPSDKFVSSNLNYAQCKPYASCMRYTATYDHDTSCFLITGDYPSPSICSASHGR